MVGRLTRLAAGGSSLFAVEGMLSKCDVWGLLSSCGGGTLSTFGGWALLSLWPSGSLELWHRPPLKFRRGISLVVVVPPLGVLCGEGVLSTCGFGGSSLVFTGLLHSSCEDLLSNYFRGFISVYGRVAAP